MAQHIFLARQQQINNNKGNIMSIKCEFLISNDEITIQLEDHLGEFDSLIEELYQQTNSKKPIEIEEISIIDNDYFKTFDEIEKFLSINFDDTDEGKIFLEWKSHTGYDMNDYETFQDAYRGTYDTVEEFCEITANDCGELENIPVYIKDCIDWKRVWTSGMQYECLDIAVENGVVFGQILYGVAIFSRI